MAGPQQNAVPPPAAVEKGGPPPLVDGLPVRNAPNHGAGTVDANQQMQFLYKALDDNQNVIRFLDAKAAFAVALLSAMAGKVLSNLSGYFPLYGQPRWCLLLVGGFAAAVLLATFIVVRIIFPSSNPSENCRLLPGLSPPFFLCELDPHRFGRIFTSRSGFSQLAQDHAAYLEQILAADSTALLRVVSGEVLKVSYIRQIKMDRLKALAHVTALSTIIFLALMVAEATVPKPPRPQLVQVEGPVQLNSPPVVLTPVPTLPERPSAPRAPKQAVKALQRK